MVHAAPPATAPYAEHFVARFVSLVADGTITRAQALEVFASAEVNPDMEALTDAVDAMDRGDHDALVRAVRFLAGTAT